MSDLQFTTEFMHDTPPFDPREQPVLRVQDYPAPPLHLVSSSRPRLEEAAEDASKHRALTAQKAERELAILTNLSAACDDLWNQNALDSGFAEKVADAMPHDIPLADRRQAGAVAVRLHDSHYQDISRYRAADVLLCAVRNLLSAHGLQSLIPDSDLRKAADRMAMQAQIARMRTWDGSQPVTAREWTQASLGLLEITEDR